MMIKFLLVSLFALSFNTYSAEVCMIDGFEPNTNCTNQNDVNFFNELARKLNVSNTHAHAIKEAVENGWDLKAITGNTFIFIKR